MIRIHTEKTLNNYSKKQLVYYCRMLEKKCNELERDFDSQYDFLKHFCSEKKSELVLKIAWKKDDKTDI